MANPGEFELVPRMRIDFNLLPISGKVRYEHSEMSVFVNMLTWQLLGLNDRVMVHLRQTHPPVLLYPAMERFDSDSAKHEKQLNQLKNGDPGFFFIRELNFVDRFSGNDWAQKFYNARQYIVEEMHCKNGNGQLLLTHLNPSEDVLHLINLISGDSTPALILKGLPYDWLAHEPIKLRNFFHSLGQLRDFHISGNHVSIQFEDYEEFCKGIKKLCSHSLKKNGNSSTIVDYELSFEDSFNASLDIGNAYNESLTSQDALNHRMAMLTKELRTFKVAAERYVGARHNHAIKFPLNIHVCKQRMAVLEKEISTLKPLIERSGARDNESPATQMHQVAILEEELNTMKVVVEEAGVAEASVCYTETPATQALKRQLQMLEHRVAMLERNNKNE